MTTTIERGMNLESLRALPIFSALDDKALTVARTCLAMTCEGESLVDVPPAHLEMVRKHAVDGANGPTVVEVEATFSRSGLQFTHWNKRTGEWWPGIGNPPMASDGRRGGWVFFEIKADSPEKAKAMADRYIGCKEASFKGGVVALDETVAIVAFDSKKIAY